MKRTLVLLTLCSTLTVTNAAPLKIVEVGAPAINCKFAASCILPVTDSTDHFSIGPTVGDAFLQSRTWPPGEVGTLADGLYGYEYRLDLRNLSGVTALPCIHQFEIDFGPVVQLDYDDDHEPDDVWVVTSGGVGSVRATSADRTGSKITFRFAPSVCAGASPGNGQSTFFFGLTSAKPPRPVVAHVFDDAGTVTDLSARAPEGISISPSSYWVLLVIVLFLVVGGSAWAVASERIRKRR
jgi:hypothetical protein